MGEFPGKQRRVEKNGIGCDPDMLRDAKPMSFHTVSSESACTGIQIALPIPDIDISGSSGNYVPAILIPGAPAPD